MNRMKHLELKEMVLVTTFEREKHEKEMSTNKRKQLDTR
jgi:hypothetical protein